jgi:hypothetical protein
VERKSGGVYASKYPAYPKIRLPSSFLQSSTLHALNSLFSPFNTLKLDRFQVKIYLCPPFPNPFAKYACLIRWLVGSVGVERKCLTLPKPVALAGKY